MLFTIIKLAFDERILDTTISKYDLNHYLNNNTFSGEGLA
jgi:hypothetical protein